MGAHLTVEQRQRVRQLRSDGLRFADVARKVGCSLRTVKRVVASRGKREERATRWSPGPQRHGQSDPPPSTSVVMFSSDRRL